MSSSSVPVEVADVTEDEDALRTSLLAKVRSIESTLAEAGPSSEVGRTLAPAAVAALRESGLIAMKSPRVFGGAEAHPTVQMDVIEAVTRIDPAAGWSLLIAAGIGARVLSTVPDAVAQEMLGGGSFPYFAGSLKPGGSARPVDGGFEVSGRWSWASGIGHADFVAVPVFREDRQGLIWAIVPFADVTPHDNWFPLGLKGTGSADFSLERVFVPERFVPRTATAVRGGALYRLGYGSAAHEHGVFACALARSALDAALETAAEKRRGYGPQQGIRDREVLQAAVGEAEMRIAASRLLMSDVAGRLFDSAAEGDAPIELQAEARAAAVFCTDQAVEVTTRLARLAGGGAVMQGSPFERLLRDLFTAQAHLFVSDSAYENLGRLRLGVSDEAPLR